MVQIDKGGKEGSCLVLEPARLRGRRVEASLAGGPRTLRRGTETLEATVAELSLVGPQGGTSISMRPVAGGGTDGSRWYGVGGFMPISLEVQRTIKRVDASALYIALCKMCGPLQMFRISEGVVQALNKGEVECITARQCLR